MDEKFLKAVFAISAVGFTLSMLLSFVLDKADQHALRSYGEYLELEVKRNGVQ